MFDFTKPIKMCTRNSCCPTIEFDDTAKETNATIKDDFGGEVILSIGELEIMSDIYRKYLVNKQAANDE